MTKYPLLDSAIYGTLAGLATKMATKHGYKGLSRLSRGLLPPSLKSSKQERLGNTLALLAGLGTSLYTMYNKGDTSKKGSFLKSLTDPNYWDNNNTPATPDYGWFKPELEKENSSFGDKNIPINFSMNLIETDPFLDLSQKKVTNSIIFNAENKALGHTSRNNLLASATKAGLGFGSAYLLSTGLSKVLSLPPPVAKKVSLAGGLAGAISNVI